MPNYGFECKKCKIRFDYIFPLSQSEEIAECPECKLKDNVRKTYNHPLPIRFNCRDFSTTYRG